MIEKIKRTIQQYDLLHPGDAVLIGLSGGPDSVALTHVLHTLRPGMNLRLGAVYINHGIRKRAAKKEEQFCRQLCDTLAIDLILIREDIPALAAQEMKGLEETARDFRYRIFAELAEKDNYNRVATGHHADDQSETILYRILRGTGRPGLLGIPAKRGNIIRPLLEVTRQEIFDYLEQKHLSYCTDESNKDISFKRNYIRHKLLKDIRREINPSVDIALRNLADLLYEEEQYLDSVVQKAVKKTVTCSPGGKIELALKHFFRYDKWLRRRLLRYCLTEASGGEIVPYRETVDYLDAACLQKKVNLSLRGLVQAVRVDDTLVLFGKRVSSYDVELIVGRKVAIPGLRLYIQTKEIDWTGKTLEIQRRSSRIVVDAQKVYLPLVVRNIRPGDRFRPLGMRGSKKVGNYLTDRKVPTVWRDEIPVVCDKKGIVWLVGYEIADRVKVDSNTRKVVTLECRKQRTGKRQAV